MNKQNLAVTHVYRTYFPDPPGGLQEAIRQIALATAQQGIANTVYTLSTQPEPRELERPEGRVVREKSWAEPASCNLGGAAAFTTFSRLAMKSDVMHYLFPWPFADLLHAVVRPEQPAVMTYISDVVRQRWLGAAYAPLMWRTPDLIRKMAEIADIPARLWPVPVWLLHTGARLLGKGAAVGRLCGNLQVDISKAKALLDWTPPISVDEGLKGAFAAKCLIKGIE